MVVGEKIHDAITHRRQHGVSNTETAAAVAALSGFFTVSIDTKTHMAMAAGAVDNAPPVRATRARRRPP